MYKSNFLFLQMKTAGKVIVGVICAILILIIIAIILFVGIPSAMCIYDAIKTAIHKYNN